MVEKVKIKLSELTDIYDIEDDGKDVEKVVTKNETQNMDWDETIDEGDKVLEEQE